MIFLSKLPVDGTRNGNDAIPQEIPQEMVIKSFKTCGISNALDGTEDDVVYSEETPEVDDEDIEENEFETDSENETDGE